MLKIKFKFCRKYDNVRESSAGSSLAPKFYDYKLIECFKSSIQRTTFDRRNKHSALLT
jgi:hypothetical protein